MVWVAEETGCGNYPCAGSEALRLCPRADVLSGPRLRDVAVIVEEALPAERIQAEIQAAGGELLRAIRLFDVYRGKSIPEGTKSLAYALTFQADDRTLTEKEVDKTHRKIVDRLTHVLKARIRGEEPTI